MKMKKLLMNKKISFFCWIYLKCKRETLSNYMVFHFEYKKYKMGKGKTCFLAGKHSIAYAGCHKFDYTSFASVL